MEKSKTVNYKRIFFDLINQKFPHRQKQYQHYFLKERFTQLDVIEINQNLFGHTDNYDFETNQKFKSYALEDVYRILEYQKKNGLTNTELARKFHLSRNTVAAWKKRIPV